ncbi:hypothetical protein MKOR_19150 [Mycolicibacillus koreensis]|nr:hypothetical protein MKOR_19150 [Mycolicibacillus koreensis]
MKIKAASPSTLPSVPGAGPAVAVTDAGAAAAAPIAPISSTPNPSPAASPAIRCPRRVSTSDSRESTPISIITNRNSIITAPV